MIMARAALVMVGALDKESFGFPEFHLALLEVFHSFEDGSSLKYEIPEPFELP